MKIPEPKKQPNGMWYIRLRLDGQYFPIREATAAECKRQAALVKAEYLNGKITAPSQKTLGELIDEYIASREAVRSPSTVEGYNNIRRNRFKSYMVQPVSKIDFQSMINEETKIVAPKTVCNAWGLVSSALKFAKLSVPTLALPQVPVNEMPWLDCEQILLFLDAVKNTPVELTALLYLHSLRASEVRALRPSNIDLAHDKILVKGAIVRGTDGMVSKDTNKSRSSTRPVPILIPRLRKLLHELPPDCEYVCNCPNASIKINRICQANGLPLVGAHGLRRSFASLCYYLGISERRCMAWGGWDDAKTMHDHYIKLGAMGENEDSEKVKQFFANTKKVKLKQRKKAL